jgi:orotidine-5'-phosphate decarboxylase
MALSRPLPTEKSCGGTAVPGLFGDRLVEAINARNAPVCVGLDPSVERLPRSIQQAHDLPDHRSDENVAAAFEEYCGAVCELVAPYVPVVKINIAFFERYHAAGIRAYYRAVKRAQQAGLLVIGDVKRADIGHSTTQYAHAHFGPHESDEQAATPDALTVNPYLGWDGIGPFLDAGRHRGAGVFVLVQTSNASAIEVQGLELASGDRFCERVGLIVQGWAAREGNIGASGYSCIGAVVSPGAAGDTNRLRQFMPNVLFLVPGFGAQGRGGEEVRVCFKPDGTGALITASRSVIYAYEKPEPRGAQEENWQASITAACQQFVEEVRAVRPAPRVPR